MGRFAGSVLNKYIAPKVSEFTAAEIPDMSSLHPESKYWIDNHFLNSIFRGEFDPPVAPYMVNYLRRVQGAFAEHDLARSATHEFLDAGRQSPGRYSLALLHWEFFLGQSWHAYEILIRLGRLVRDDDSYKIFQKGDGSVEHRLHLLYNAMKHVEGRISRGEIPEGTVSPVWLQNEGIECTEGIITYEETGDVLRDLAENADLLVDPTTMIEKLRQMRDRDGEPDEAMS